MEAKKEFTGIDLAKLICAFLVVAIHAEPFRNYIWLDRGLGLFTRFPVPFFFTAAGFFLCLPGKGRISFDRLLKYVKRIGILYFLWAIVYSPVLINRISFTENIGNALIYILRKVFWDGVNSHLWFLMANIYAVLLTWLCYKKLSPKATLGISAVLLIFGTLFSTYSEITKKIIGGGTGYSIFLM